MIKRLFLVVGILAGLLNPASSTIYINDPTPDDGLPYTHVLTSNLTDAVVLGPDVSLDLNGFGIIGPGNDVGSIGILSNTTGTEVYGGYVTGFGAGIHLGGGNSAVHEVAIYDCLVRGIGIAGGNSSVHDSTVVNIGSLAHPFYGAAAGIVMWDENNYLASNVVRGIRGQFESVAYTVGGSAELRDNLAQGAGGTGWTFGLWISTKDGTITVDSMRIFDFDTGIGGYFKSINLSNSTIELGHQYTTYPIIYLDGNKITTTLPDSSEVIVGSAGRDTIVGGDGDNKIVGAGGADTIFSGAGSDIYVFSPGAAMIIAPDFEQGVDKISTADYHAESLQYGSAATGADAVFVWDKNRHVLMYDPDGAGPAQTQDIAYIPYVKMLQPSDFLW